MNLCTAAQTDVGLRRRANEDRFSLDPALGLCLVADGMGGHSAGQVASELAADTVRGALGSGSPSGRLAERLRAAIEEANRAIYAAARENESWAGMGTTVVALLAADGRAAIAHVGDSRAYRVRAGRIRQLTDDHSVVGELLRRHEISADDAREHPQRHVLTRALGVRGSVQPDLAELTLAPGDLFVLCSDGLTNHVEDDEIAKLAAAPGELEDACRALVGLAKRRGGEDNITVVLARCDED